MKKLLAFFILFQIMIGLSAQETENKNLNNRISTSWGYNVHIYKGMFDFKPPVVDTSSIFYPDAYYYYSSFHYVSELHFNWNYKINKKINLYTGADLYLTIFQSKPNMELFNSITIDDYKTKWVTNCAYLGIPVGVYYNIKNFNIGAGVSTCLISFYNSKSLYNNRHEEITMDLDFFSATNSTIDFLLFLEFNYDSILRTKKHNFGLNFRTSNSTFLLYEIG
jgi:hypothetical protein